MAAARVRSPGLDWSTKDAVLAYTESKADLDREMEGVHTRLAALERALERAVDQQHDLRLEVTVLRTTNRLLAGVGSVLGTVMGLVIAALALWRR